MDRCDQERAYWRIASGLCHPVVLAVVLHAFVAAVACDSGRSRERALHKWGWAAEDFAARGLTAATGAWLAAGALLRVRARCMERRAILRMRRGECPRCGFELGWQRRVVCTECGLGRERVRSHPEDRAVR